MLCRAVTGKIERERERIGLERKRGRRTIEIAGKRSEEWIHWLDGVRGSEGEVDCENRWKIKARCDGHTSGLLGREGRESKEEVEINGR